MFAASACHLLTLFHRAASNFRADTLRGGESRSVEVCDNGLHSHIYACTRTLRNPLSPILDRA